MEIMNTPNAFRKPALIWGILSLVLSPLGLLLVVYFASAAGWGVVHPRRVIVFAQYSLLLLLGSGLASGVTGVVRHEQLTRV